MSEESPELTTSRPSRQRRRRSAKVARGETGGVRIALVVVAVGFVVMLGLLAQTLWG